MASARRFARHRYVAAHEHRLGLIIERAQKLPLPAVPHARPHRLDVGDGEDQQQLEPFGTLHHLGEIEDRLVVVEIALLGESRS